jgi:hypothetical protein
MKLHKQKNNRSVVFKNFLNAYDLAMLITRLCLNSTTGTAENIVATATKRFLKSALGPPTSRAPKFLQITSGEYLVLNNYTKDY